MGGCMAAEWIKWTKGLTRKREVIAVARKLNLHRRVVACLCMEFWEWADSETHDGHVRGATTEVIDELVGQPGFAACLADSEVGWLRVTDAGITLPNFERHNGESSKARAQDAERKRLSRLCPSSVRDLSKESPPPSSLLSSSLDSSSLSEGGIQRGEPIRLLWSQVSPIYEAYPRHRRGGKGGFVAAVEPVWGLLHDRGTAYPGEVILAAVRAYAGSWLAKNDGGRAAVGPARFFGDGVWEQAPSDWAKPGSAPVLSGADLERVKASAADRERAEDARRNAEQQRIRAMLEAERKGKGAA